MIASSQRILNTLDILARLSWGEGDDLELKSAKGGLPGSLWETYSAMANTRGGVILLGVENDGAVSGINDSTVIRKNFWDVINNRGKVSVNLLQANDVQEIVHPLGLILAIRIPRATRYQVPIFIGQNPLTGTYRRNSEGDYRCTEQEISRMWSDRSQEPADSRILEHFTMEDLDLLSIQQYRQRLRSHKPTHPWLDENDKGLLTKLNGWRACRTTQVQGVTVAGLLMFGREEALREALPQYQIDFREKLSADPGIRWTDRLTLDGTWSGNLYQFYVRVIQKLSADLKLPFQLNEDLFRTGETIVHVALRETLVNALIHADYHGQGGIVIEKYHDRFEFSNPGSLLMSIDQILYGNISECRNKSVQTMFTMIGAAEKAGSGVDKIRLGWNSQYWRSPIVRDQMQPDRVLWVLPMVSLIPDASLARLKIRFGSKFSKCNQLEIQALVTADIEGYVDNARMRQITNKHAADITKLFQDLVSQGMLVQDGQGRWTRYCLSAVSHSVHMAGDSVHMAGDSVHMAGDSVHMAGDSVHMAGDSVHMAGDSVHIEQVSNDERDALLLIAAPARKNNRLPPAKMEQIILKLCLNRWLTRRELAELLDRHQDGLRSRFLTQMVSHGLLQLRYPDKPNRVDQAYSNLQSTE